MRPKAVELTAKEAAAVFERFKDAVTQIVTPEKKPLNGKKRVRKPTK